MQPTNGECPHQNVATHTTGQFYFAGGEIVDTLEDQIVCTDCGNVVFPAANTEIFEVNVFAELPAWEDVIRCG